MYYIYKKCLTIFKNNLGSFKVL